MPSLGLGYGRLGVPNGEQRVFMWVHAVSIVAISISLRKRTLLRQGNKKLLSESVWVPSLTSCGESRGTEADPGAIPVHVRPLRKVSSAGLCHLTAVFSQ